MRDRRRAKPATGSLELADLPVAALVVDRLGRVVAVNPHAERLFARVEDRLVGCAIADLLGRDVLWSHRDGRTQHWTALLPVVDRDAQRVHVVSSAWPGREGAEWTLVAVVAEPPDSSALAERLPRVLDWRDVAGLLSDLTGSVTCLLVRLVGLKDVNDEHSRSMGDSVLATIHERLIGRCPTAVVARVSSDTFVVADAAGRLGNHLAEELVELVRAPVDVPLGRVAIGALVGVAVGDARSALIVLDRAQRNLERAERRGAGTVVRDVPARPAGRSKVTEVAGSLMEAVAAGRIGAHFQPIVDLYDERRVVEYEALARWAQNPEESLVATDFLGAAELTGVLGTIFDGVMVEVLLLGEALVASLEPPLPRLSVNASVPEVLHDGFPERMREALEALHGGPELQVEVPAAIAPDLVDEVAVRLDVLRALGVRVALDGVGGPDSSPWALRTIEVDAVKLSAALMTGLGDDPRAERFLRAVLELVADVGTVAIAKGVESVAQHEVLLRHGCRYAQGYLYGEPRPRMRLGLAAAGVAS